MISSQTNPEATTTFVRDVLKRTPMKNQMTREAFVQAMASATAVLRKPKS